MPCYSPLRAVLRDGPKGRVLEFSRSAVGKALSLPCGRCIGCRLERARQWAVRLMHEASMHEDSCFLTLTYDEEHCPKDMSLSVVDCQLFLKRLRARLEPKRIRFFLCGEYGEENARPHYHAIIFGYAFPDRVQLESKGKYPLYRSDEAEAAWGQGRVWIGAVSFDSAAYVANYATKKVVGEKAEEFYKGRKPEFLLMSRRPGIGKSWIDKFGAEVLRDDEVIVRGKEARPPRYYDGVLALREPTVFALVKERREAVASRLESVVQRDGSIVGVAPGNNARRLAVRKAVAEAKLRAKLRR